MRVVLNGRRVDAWVVAVGHAGDPDFSVVEAGKLSPLLDVADLGVDEQVVPLAQWVAAHWAGPLRTVLSTATPDRKRARPVHGRRGRATNGQPDVSPQVAALLGSRGGVLRVPPLESAMSVVVQAAARGTVLVLCPTLRMARLGAAYLRRTGLTTAELPDQVDAAIAGVDVVIGARSAVLAPCAGMASIVVVDEHDESYHDERVPTWWAPEIAWERGRRAGVPVLLTSPVPSAAAELLCGPVIDLSAQAGGWPRVRVVNLLDVPVKGSLISEELLTEVRTTASSVLCVLNTKGTARMLACRSCRSLQTCPGCNSAVASVGDVLACPACRAERAAVCQSCGRTALVNVRSGTARLAEELAAAGSLPVVEVTSSTDGVGGGSAVYVGTDALLHRVTSAGTVVFLDIDRDLSAPRMGAGRECLAAVARAARIVGRGGTVIIQTRQPQHPLVVSLASGTVDEYLRADTELARSMGLPPFSTVAVMSADPPIEDRSVPVVPGVEWSNDGERLVARSPDRPALLDFVARVRAATPSRVRVSVNPPRI